jgi:hypothetical protein
LLLFIGINLIRISPYSYDNTKVYVWIIITLNIPLLYLIWRYRNKLKYGWVLCLAIILTQSTSGGLSILEEIQNAKKPEHLFAKKTNLEVGEYIRNKTPKESIILSITSHSNPASMLAGRQTVLGFRGWLWTYGINTEARSKEVQRVLGLKEGWEDVIKKYNVDYIMVDYKKDKIKSLTKDPKYSERKGNIFLKRIFDNNKWRIYEVSSKRPQNAFERNN